jgi:membrane fusion protein, multidrug efflux system
LFIALIGSWLHCSTIVRRAVLDLHGASMAMLASGYARSIMMVCCTVLCAAVGHADDENGVPVRGVVRAIDQAALSTEIQARALTIGFREGESFKAGDLLIAFDCERYRAEAQSAEAVSREMRLTLESNQQLEKFRAVGKHDVEISRARVEKAEAEAQSLKSRLQHCDVYAPYDGRVAELSINRYEQPQPSKPFLVIVGHNRLEIEVIVPSHWLSWLAPGAALSFHVDETKRIYPARIARIGASVDAVSQMIKVIATFDSPVTDVLPGMSGAAQFERPHG